MLVFAIIFETKIERLVNHDTISEVFACCIRLIGILGALDTTFSI